MQNQTEKLLDETRLLWHVMVTAFEHLHAREPVTLGMRAVLEYLVSEGPATVPHIARARRVSRQHIQTQVNALEPLLLVKFDPNPDHRRSVLVTLTSAGRKMIERMQLRERRFLEKTSISATNKEIALATKTLGAVRSAIEVAT
jgi:DNA-binding MarR family transcriptional regulator